MTCFCWPLFNLVDQEGGDVNAGNIKFPKINKNNYIEQIIKYAKIAYLIGISYKGNLEKKIQCKNLNILNVYRNQESAARHMQILM